MYILLFDYFERYIVLHVLLMIIMTGGFFSAMFGGQELVVIKACIDVKLLNLHYISQKYIEYCNTYNMNAQNNSPFFVYWSYEIKSINNFKKDKNELKISEIFNDSSPHHKYCRNIPFSCLLKNNNFNFKTVGEELFSFQRKVDEKNVTFSVVLDTDFSGWKASNLIDAFKKKPLYDLDNDEKELLEAEIITKNNEGIQHGPKGYFKEEELSQIKNTTEKEQNMSSWNLRNICYILIPVIFIYISYKLFMMRQA